MEPITPELFNEDSKGNSSSAPGKNEFKKLKEQFNAAIKENESLRTRLRRQEDRDIGQSNLKPDKTFGINVCGDIMLTKMEVEIVDTPYFQRLAYVNQLGSTSTVYRSANHTRFEHSLGVLKMADLMIQKIRSNKHSEPKESEINQEEEQLIRLLALLHDIGHMPFGHTIEDEFNIFQSHDKHLSRWQLFLGPESQIGKIIIRHRGEEFYNRFFRLIKCEKDFRTFEDDAFMYDIVSNTVCADLLDYLQRDCEYTNLKLNFHPRFLDYLIIKDVPNSKTQKTERRIVIRLCKTRNNEPRKDIQSELVQLIRNRYYLGERVYYHHTKIKTGTLIAAAVLRAKEAGFFNYAAGHSHETTYNGGDSPLFDIHTWGDVETLTYLKNIKAQGEGQKATYLRGAKKLAEAYLNRTVYYQLHEYSKEDLSLNSNLVKEIIEKKIGMNRPDIFEMRLISEFGDPISRLSYEERICELLPDMESGDFLIYFPNYKMQMKLAEVKVEDKDQIARSLRECLDELIREECEEIIEKHQDIWRLRVFIHPRFICPKNDEEREKYKLTYGRDFPDEYKDYATIIEKYCKAIFSKPGNGIQKDFYEEFWKESLEFILDRELDKNESNDQRDLYNPFKLGDRKNRAALIGDLAEELSNNTSAKRSKHDILGLLKSKFAENYKKS